MLWAQINQGDEQYQYVSFIKLYCTLSNHFRVGEAQAEAELLWMHEEVMKLVPTFSNLILELWTANQTEQLTKFFTMVSM